MYQFQTIGVASDHAGIELKAVVLGFVTSLNLTAVDYGPDTAPLSSFSVDYPDFALKLSTAYQTGEIDGCIGICGTGIGMAVALNKYNRGLRAASLMDPWAVRFAREHNDLNALCLGARLLTSYCGIDLVRIWLETAFLGGRHQIRLDKIK